MKGVLSDITVGDAHLRVWAVATLFSRSTFHYPYISRGLCLVLISSARTGGGTIIAGHAIDVMMFRCLSGNLGPIESTDQKGKQLNSMYRTQRTRNVPVRYSRKTQRV